MSRIGIAVKTTEGGRWIVPQIVEARSRGHHVFVLLPNGTGRLIDLLDERFSGDEQVQIVRAPVDFLAGGVRAIPRRLVQLRKQIRTLRLDAILYHLYATALSIRLATVGMSLRRVHMIAGPLFLESPKIRAIERLLARMDSTIICGSRYTFERYRELGVPSRHLEVVPYGVDLAVFATPNDSDRDTARQQHGFSEDTFVVVMVAYVYAPKKLVFAGRGIKGHEDILDAWPQFAKRHPNARLLLVGGGFDEPAERYRHEMISRVPGGLNDNGITWLDSVHDVRSVYMAADVSVSPSLSDNHGAALEASAMGVPCIVSDAGALPETVAEGAGWVFAAGSSKSLGEALESAYDAYDSGRLPAIARRARALVERDFSQLDGSRRVIDAVLAVKSTREPPTITIFSESRLHRGADGTVVSEDPTLAGTAWQRALVAVPGLRLAARVDPVRGHEGAAVDGHLVQLPYYVGLRQMARKIPALVRSVRNACLESDVVYVKVPSLIGTIAAIGAKRKGVLVAAEVVGDIGEVLRSGVAGRTGRAFAATAVWLARLAVRNADVVCYVTNRVLQKRYPAASGAATFVYSDVIIDDELVMPTTTGVRSGVIVAVGSHEQLYKGHDDLIRALPRLAGLRPDIRLILIGNGRYQDKLRSLARENNVSERVEFAGFISDRSDLCRRLRDAEIFAMPSKTEGMPRALIEAMALGLPCVATRVGGIPELLSEDVMVPPGDIDALAAVLSRLLGDADLQHKQSIRNVHRAKEYARSNMEAARLAWRRAVVEMARDGRAPVGRSNGQ